MAERKIKRVAVVGSGPAGLAAAYAAALNGAEVTLFEQMKRCGLKLLASGGGKCNVTNTLELEDFAQTFGNNWRFLLPALKMFHGKKILDFFELHQVRLIKSDGFHYFPESMRSSDVVNMWLDALKSLRVKVLTDCCIDELIIENGSIKGVRSKEKQWSFDSVILCCGGKSYPALGGLGKGYKLAGQAGHTITPLYPAMTGMKCREEWVKECSGISLEDATCFIDLKRDRKNIERGELLFTRNGFSAFAVLDLAGRVAQLLDEMQEDVPVVIDFLPKMSESELVQTVNNWRIRQGKKSVSTLLTEYFPRRLADFLLNNTDSEASQFKKSDAELLISRIKKHPFKICGVESWDKAMVTKGGVSLKEISPETLESRIVSGLYFSGELLDVTGRCGGYNITWAFASGICAGTASATPDLKEQKSKDK